MKFRYPITASYVSDWKLPHAVREVIAAVLTAEPIVVTVGPTG